MPEPSQPPSPSPGSAPPPFNPPLPPSASHRAKYYERFFGRPRMFWQENEAEAPTIHLLGYPPSPALEREYYTIITSGMSDARMPIPDDENPALARAELLLYALPADLEQDPKRVPWFVSVLHAIAHMPWRLQTWLAEAHTIPNGDPPAPFVENSSLTTALLLPPVFEKPEFASQLSLNGDRVNFYWLSFLTTPECDFKLANGYEALMERFESANFPQVVQTLRSSLIQPQACE